MRRFFIAPKTHDKLIEKEIIRIYNKCSYFFTQTCFVGGLKNRLKEMVLYSTKNTSLYKLIEKEIIWILCSKYLSYSSWSDKWFLVFLISIVRSTHGKQMENIVIFQKI